MKKGKQIKTLEDLAWASNGKKSVTCPKSYVLHDIHPASQIYAFPGSLIMKLIKFGLYEVKE